MEEVRNEQASTSTTTSGSPWLISLIALILAAGAIAYCYYLYQQYQVVQKELKAMQAPDRTPEMNAQELKAYMDSLSLQPFQESTEAAPAKKTVKQAPAPNKNFRKKGGAPDGNRSFSVQIEGVPYDVYMVKVDNSDIRVYRNNANGIPLMNISNLKQEVELQGRQLWFATNGGIFHPNLNPVGLLVVDGKTLSPLNTQEGTGNFFLKPNGVFYVTKSGKAGIIQSEDYPRIASEVEYATQSGPLLVQYGSMVNNFTPNSQTRFIRSGVGMVNDNTLVFLISKTPVNFYQFAAAFAQHFRCFNALYLDGAISKMYLPAVQRYELDGSFGVLIGITN